MVGKQKAIFTVYIQATTWSSHTHPCVMKLMIEDCKDDHLIYREQTLWVNINIRVFVLLLDDGDIFSM